MSERFEQKKPGQEVGGVEKREGAYTPDQIANFLFWSFYVSQGQVPIQESLYNATCVAEPEFASSTLAWLKSLGVDIEDRIKRKDGIKKAFAENPVLMDLHKRTYLYVGSKNHLHRSESKGEDGSAFIQGSLVGELDTLCQTAILVESREGGKRYEKYVDEFIFRTLAQETALLKLNDFRKKFRPELTDLRKQKKFSLLVSYGLSVNRKQERKFLPQAFQDIFETAGKRIQDGATPLTATELKKLKTLIKAYSESTGETVTLQ